MNKLKFKIAKWLLHSDGFQFAAPKAENGNTWIDGDPKVIRYVDVSGYFFNKEPLKRSQPKPDVTNTSPIKKLTPEQLKELGLLSNE